MNRTFLLTRKKSGERSPLFIPQWFRRRIEPDTFAIYDFVKQAAKLLAPGSRVLDAGAGQGRFKPEFLHTRYVGVDLAVGDPTWDYSNLDAICDLQHLPFSSGVFNAILCIQVLEHIQNPLDVLRELERVLQPDGLLFLSVPQSWPQHQKPFDFYRYTSFGLRYLLEKAGFYICSIKPIGGYFWFLSFQLQNINYWIFPKDQDTKDKKQLLTWPIRALLSMLFQIILPIALYHLDKLDRIRDETIGYLCIACKPSHAL
jgi:SAM-dependent methyltransferase